MSRREFDRPPWYTTELPPNGGSLAKATEAVRWRIDLSEDGRELMRIHFTAGRFLLRRSRQESLPGRSVEQTHRAYREHVAAGLMEASTFAGRPRGTPPPDRRRQSAPKRLITARQIKSDC